VLMKCGEYREALIEWARGGVAGRPLKDHVADCAACARFLDSQMALSAAMRLVAAEEFSERDAVPARVMAEFDRAQVHRWRWATAAGLAVAACLSAFWVLGRAPAPAQPPDTQAFLNIPYTVPLAPEESAAIWRTHIPVAALIAAGFHVQVSDPSAMVEADVLVSQDGRARAIRPLSISMTN
jgi:hypothetical protein